MPLVGHSAVGTTRRTSNLERERRRRKTRPSGAAKVASTTAKTGAGSGDTPSGTETVSTAGGASVRSSDSPLSVWLSPDVGNAETRAGNGGRHNNTTGTAGACSPPGKSTARPSSPRHEHVSLEGTKNATPTSSPRDVHVPEAVAPCEERPSHRREEYRYRGERETRGLGTSTAETFRERLDRRLDGISLPVRGPGRKRLTSRGLGTEAANRSAQGGIEESSTVAAAKATKEDVAAAATAAETARGRAGESSAFLGHSCSGEARTVVGVAPPAGEITAAVTQTLRDGEGLAIEEDESRTWEWEKVKVDWTKKPSL